MESTATHFAPRTLIRDMHEIRRVEECRQGKRNTGDSLLPKKRRIAKAIGTTRDW